MGEIIHIKEGINKIVYKIKISLEELCQLKNNLREIHLFSTKSFSNKAKIIQRGNNGGAKYIEIPLQLKSKRKNKFSTIAYQKIILKDKVFYILIGYKNQFKTL